jgi:DNA gyrase subunit A
MGIGEAYRTGRGRIHRERRHRSKEAGSERARIVVTELPYQVNKARLIEKIAELVRAKRRSKASAELRDESDKDGMRIVVELRAATPRRSC